MTKPILGLVVGGALGLLDGLSAWFSPEVRPILLGIVIGSTVKGLITGLLAGFIARWRHSMVLGVLSGLALGLVGSSLAAIGHPDYYFDIVLPGMLVGAIVGFVTQRYPAAVRSGVAARGLVLLAVMTMGSTILCAIAPTTSAAFERGQAAASPLRLLVVTGGHDYPTSFYTLFEQPGLTWDHETPSESAYRRDLRSRYDVLAMYDMPKTLSAQSRANLQAYAESGKGILVLHHALCSNNDWEWYRELVGGRYLIEPQDGRPASTYSHDETIPVAIAGSHPITRNVALTEVYDETYKGMWISPQVMVLLTTTHPKADAPLAWISPYSKSRVVAIQLGHGREAHNHPGYRTLVRNAILWSAGQLQED